MKKKYLLILSALLLTGCAFSLVKNEGKENNLEVKQVNSYSEDALYLLGSFNSYEASESYRFLANPTQNSNKEYDYYLKNVSLEIGDIFYISKIDESVKFDSTNLVNTIYTKKNDDDNNIKVKRKGIFDIYVDANYSKVQVVSSAKSLLTRQDLNYTRKTVINMTNSSFLDLKNNLNYYNQITAERVTYFIDNGLFMTTSDYSINSGYYSPRGSTNMYHYTVKSTAALYDNPGATIENVRLDSKTENVNDFFYNAHYFYNNAEEFADLYEFSMLTQVYKATDERLIEAYIAFTAPLLVINENVNFTFNAVGLVDLSTNKTQFRLYTDDSQIELKDNANCFSSATIEGIGTTHIDVLDQYIG